MEGHIHRAIRAKAENYEEVTAQQLTTSSGDRRTWFIHEPCDDGSTIHGENDGFMACRHSEEGFILECDACGYSVDYE